MLLYDQLSLELHLVLPPKEKRDQAKLYLFEVCLFIATLIVFALSLAEIPVEIPFFDSIDTVNAVCVLDLLIDDIKGSDNF